MIRNKPSYSALKTLVSASLLFFTLAAEAKEKVDKRLETSATPHVEIEHVSGKAQIIGWEKNEVYVSGELGERTEEFTFKKSGNDITIQVETNHRKINWKEKDYDDGDDLTIYVPEKSAVSYTAVNAGVNIRSLTDSVQLEVVNGDIEASDIDGRVKLETVNGDVSLKSIRGQLQVETVNGNVEGEHEGQALTKVMTVNGNVKLRTTSPVVEFESVNGDAELELALIKSLSLTTVNGEIEASMVLDAKADVEASSVGGTISLTMQEDVSARFELEAHAGGDIVNKITDDKQQSAKYGPSKWLEFTVNKGTAGVEMSTVHGELVVKTK